MRIFFRHRSVSAPGELKGVPTSLDLTANVAIGGLGMHMQCPLEELEVEVGTFHSGHVQDIHK